MPLSLLRKDVCISNFIRDLISNNSVGIRTSIHLPFRRHAIPKGFDLSMGYRHFASVAEEYKKKSFSRKAGGRVAVDVSDGKINDGSSRSWVSSKVKYKEKDRVMSGSAKLKMGRNKVGNMEFLGKEGGGSGKRRPAYNTEKPKLYESKLKPKVRKGSQVEPVANEGSESGFVKKQKKEFRDRESRGKLYISKSKPNMREPRNVASIANEAGGSGKRRPAYNTEKPKLYESKLKSNVRKGSQVEPVANDGSESGFVKKQKKEFRDRESRGKLYISKSKPNMREPRNGASIANEAGGSGKRRPAYNTEKPKLYESKLKSNVRKGSQVEPIANEGSESGFVKKQKKEFRDKESRGKLYISKLKPNMRESHNVASTANEAGGSGFLKKHKKPNIDREDKTSSSIDRLKSMRKKRGNVADVTEEDGQRGLERKHVKQSYASIRKSNADGTASDLGKKAVKERKRKLEDGEKLDDKPKKKKRVIKIDPYDISNKRLDDSVALEGTTKEKGKDPGKSEMSRNAQFRAIQPSPSILSFVEDNLLGRRRSIDFKRAGYNIDLSAPLDNIPFSTSTERERIEETIFRNKLEFFAAAKVSSSFPDPELPEIAFAGRSNVGKSSLLNSLTRQWGVARTSDKPGLTQTINFFKLGKKLCLVDLPGYGFAYAKEEVKENWEELVKEYVSTRAGLRRVCLLIDTKWGMKPRDHELIDLMERSQTKYQIMLTKTDVVFPIDVARRAMQIEENLKAKKSLVQPVMMVSSKSGAGIRSLRTVLAKIARFAKP